MKTIKRSTVMRNFFWLFFVLSLNIFTQSIPEYARISNCSVVAGGYYQIPISLCSDNLSAVEATVLSSNKIYFVGDVKLENYSIWGKNQSPIFSNDPLEINAQKLHWGLVLSSPIHGEFSPVSFKIQVENNLNDSSQLFLFWESAIFINKDHQQSNPEKGSSVLTIFNNGVLGGENGILDVLNILDVSSGKIIVSDREKTYLDLDGNFQVNSNDAKHRMWKLFKRINKYPVETGNDTSETYVQAINSENFTIQESNNTVILTLNDIPTNGDLDLKLPKRAWVENPENVYSSMNIGSESTKLSFVNSENSNFKIVVHEAKKEEISISGTINAQSSIVLTSKTEGKTTPAFFKLDQNYPNPFNPSTTISYQLPSSSFVNLKVYDVLGKEVATLVNKEKSTGNYEVKFNASYLPSGVYVYKITTTNFSQTRKMLLVK